MLQKTHSGLLGKARVRLLFYLEIGKREKKKTKPTDNWFGLVEHRGFEPLTPTLPVLCAPSCANAPDGAGKRT